MLIASETFADGPAKYLALNNEEYGREIAIGSTWIRIRVGAMIQLEADGTNNILTGSLRMGISSSKSDHAGNATPSFWLGGLWNSTGADLNGSTWAYTAAGGNPHFRGGGAVRAQILAGIITAALGAGTPALPTNTGTVKRRWPLLLELRKSGTNIIVALAVFNAPSDAISANDFTHAQFLEMMLNPSDGTSGVWPTINGIALNNFGASTFGNYPTNAGVHGEVDAVQFGWNKVLTAMRLFSIAVVRFE
jgi:hypothetical protein